MSRLKAALAGAAVLLGFFAVGVTPAIAEPLPAPSKSTDPTPTPGKSADPRDASSSATPTPKPPPGKDKATPNAPDGYFYAYEDAWFEGEYCRWDGDHSNYVYADWLLPSDGQCWNYFIDPEMNDAVSSVWNNGYAGSYDAVRMFKHAEYGAPWMCLSQGDYWADLNLGWERFSDGTFANDQISSHRWVNGC